MMKKILVTVMALSLFACTSGKLEQLGGVRTLSAFRGVHREKQSKESL